MVSGHALTRMFQKEVLRNLALEGDAVIRWSGKTRATYDAVFASLLSFDGSMHSVSWNRFKDIYVSKRYDFLLGPVSIDPFLMDAYDCLNILVSFDVDHARRRNDVGLGKAWTFEGHRLFSQIREIQRLSWPDIRTLNRIICDYLGQLSRHVAEALNEDVFAIREILEQRHPDFGFFTHRMTGMCDLRFNFLERNHIWSTPKSTRVYVAPNNDGTIYEEIAAALLMDASCDDFYDRHNRDPFDRNAVRTINGRPVPYPTLCFPPDPDIARCLMSKARRFDPDVIICVSTESLVDYRKPIPVREKPRRDITSESPDWQESTLSI